MLLDNANGTLATEGLASDLDACGVSRCLVQRKVWNSAEAVQTSKTFDESPPETPYSSSGRSSDTVELAPGAPEELPSEVPSPRSQTPESAPSAYAAELESSTTFSDFCNDGRAWTWTNLLVKINRWTVSMIKQVYLIFMTLSLPTNHLMLSFRTLPRDFEEPNANGDYLAAKFRNAVMPRRGQLHDRKSMLIKINRSFIECPVLGIPGIVRFIDVRTQWFDEGMQRALDAGIKQVVIIAAGYDTRAYRLHRPGVRFYEVDLPHASRKKQELVRELLQADKYPRPEFVAADLSKVKLADALAHTSFSPYMPTLFTAEGLTYYLPPTALQQLLTCISNSSAPGSHLMMDFLHLSSLSGNVWHPGFETLRLSVYNKGEPMYSGIDERPESVAQLLKLFDFETRTVLTARDMVKRYMPHKDYRAKPPTVSPYFGYLEAVKL